VLNFGNAVRHISRVSLFIQTLQDGRMLRQKAIRCATGAVVCQSLVILRMKSDVCHGGICLGLPDYSKAVARDRLLLADNGRLGSLGTVLGKQ
jgi:hypothetical protein